MNMVVMGGIGGLRQWHHWNWSKRIFFFFENPFVDPKTPFLLLSMAPATIPLGMDPVAGVVGPETLPH